MSVFGTPRTFHKKFKFIVEIDSMTETYAGFRTCSELSVEAAKIEYYEGGGVIPDKTPGRLTYSDITLERGATLNRDLYEWFRSVANAASGQGLVDAYYKRTLDIVQKDRDGLTLRRWRLHNAWPQKFVAGDWDSDSDENVIESVTLTYDYFELIQ